MWGLFIFRLGYMGPQLELVSYSLGGDILERGCLKGEYRSGKYPCHSHTLFIAYPGTAA